MPQLYLRLGMRSRIELDLREDSGTLLARAAATFADESHFVKASKSLGLPRDRLVAAVDKFQRSGRESDVYRVEMDGRSSSLTVRVRSLLGSVDSAAVSQLEDPVSDFEGLLRAPCELTDPVVEWEDAALLCAVDLDSTTWTDAKLTAWLETFEPRPSLSWVTKSGGLRLLYGASGRLNAEECAAVAYLCLSTSEQYKSLEMKTDTRFPPGPMHRRAQQDDFRPLRRWLRQFSATDSEAAEWLAERGLTLGGRYEHSVCPVAPSNTAKGQPVSIGDRGVFCFVCEAHGVARGSNRPGFFPYSHLVGGSSATLLYHCIEGMAHWEHAQHVVADRFGLRNRAAKVAYGAAVKAHHDGLTDSGARAVLSAGKNVVRLDGRWSTINGQTYTKEVGAVLTQLPAACDLVDGKLRPSKVKVATLQQTFDLAPHGYPHLTPVFGMKVYSHFMESEDCNRVRVVVQAPMLARENMERYRPRYVPPAERARSPWSVIERTYPGICRSFVELLIVARGVSEGVVGMPPMIFATGPSGASKSSSIQIAAAMCGDNSTSVQWTNNIERVRQAIFDRTGSFVAFNDLLKESAKNRLTGTQAMDFILNLTPESSSWKAYIGPVLLGDLPVFVFTDTDVPQEVRQDVQLARRLVHVHLPSQVDWNAADVNQIDRVRVRSPEHADACNDIVSGVIDEYFRTPTTFEAAAAKLGFLPLHLSGEAGEAREALSRLFDAVCKAPALTGSDAVRWSGRGWKCVMLNMESELTSTWDQVCDESRTSSRRCSEVDWGKLLCAKEAVKFECRAHGAARVAIRFKSVAGTKQEYRVNEELR